MAKTAKPGDAGNGGVTNLTDTKAVVAEEVRNILRRNEQIAELSSANTASRKRVKTYGVPQAALAYAIKIKQMDPEDRQKHDEGCAIARDALGLGFQRSLFEMLDERLDAESQVAAAKVEKNKPAAKVDHPDDDSDLAGGDNVTSLDKARAHLNGEAAKVPDAVS